jgi:hypothetical protein
MVGLVMWAQCLHLPFLPGQASFQVQLALNFSVLY